MGTISVAAAARSLAFMYVGGEEESKGGPDCRRLRTRRRARSFLRFEAISNDRD